MIKPYISSRHLSEHNRTVSNEYMARKIHNARALVNMKTPESFLFYKNQFHRSKMQNTKSKIKNLYNSKKKLYFIVREFEIQKDNTYLFKHIMDINNASLKKQIELSKLRIQPKNNYISGSKKLEYLKVAQENQLMLKRLKERTSCYDVSQWEKDYEQNQLYKRNKCIFPSINFAKTQRYTITEGNKKTNYPLGKSMKLFHEFDAKDFEGVKNLQCQEKKKEEERKKKKKLEEEKKKPKKLYETQDEIGDLGKCNIQFIVFKDNFKIKIESVDYPEKAFECIFDDRDSVEEVQKYYKKYKEMVSDLNYDSDDDVITFENENKPKFQYVIYFLIF